MTDSPVNSDIDVAFVQGNDSSSSGQSQDGYNINFQQFSSQGGNAANTNEYKQAAQLLSGEFADIYEETKKMIKDKQYKKVLSLLEQYRPVKGLSVSQKILINRRMLMISNKILKMFSHDADFESEDKILQLIERTVRLISESYRFLNIYICKILPNILNDAFLSDASHLTSDDENDRFPIKRIKSAFESLHSYDIKKDKDDKKNQQEHKGGDRFSQPLTDKKIYKMINDRYNQPLNMEFELNQYIIMILQFFLRVSNIYKRSMKFKICFFYLKEANSIVNEVSCYQNPEIVHLSAKLRITLANFYYEAQRPKLAIDYTENAIFLMQFEFQLRMCDKSNPNAIVTKKENGRQLNCIKTLIITLINLSLFYEDIEDFQRLYETAQLAEYISQKFLKGIDEIKKYVGKIFSEITKRYETYLTEVGELDLIVRQVLWKEANYLSKEWDESQPNEENKFVKQFDTIFFEKFKVGNLNSTLKIKTKKHEKQYISVEHMDKDKFSRMEGEKLNKKIQSQKVKEKQIQNSGDKEEEQNEDNLEGTAQESSSQNEKFSSDFIVGSPSYRDGNASPSSSWHQSMYSNAKSGSMEIPIKNRHSLQDDKMQIGGEQQSGYRSPKSSIQFQKLDKINEASQDEEQFKERRDSQNLSKSLTKEKRSTHSSNQINRFNEKQTNITVTDEDDSENDNQDSKTQSELSFFDLGASFFQNSEFEEDWKSQVKSSVQQPSQNTQIENKQQTQSVDKLQQQQASTNKYHPIDPRTLKKKPVFIKQHPPDYKSKVLTSNDYYDNFVPQSTPKKALKTIIDENIEKYMKLLRYPRNAEEFQVKYLEEYIKKIVVNKIQTEKINDPNIVNDQFQFLMDRDEMDKKRFEFARKIVHLKLQRSNNNQFKDGYNDLYLEHKLELERNGAFQLMMSDTVRELDKIKQFKKDRNVDLVIDKGLNVDLNDEMTKALESKLQEKKKKKSLREAIFKHRDSWLFSTAKNLKTVYQNYLSQLRELEKTERIKKEQQERDRHKEEEQKYNELQKQQQQQQQNINQDGSPDQILQKSGTKSSVTIGVQQQQDQQVVGQPVNHQIIQHPPIQSSVLQQSQYNVKKSSTLILKQHSMDKSNKKNIKSRKSHNIANILEGKDSDIDNNLKKKTQSLKEMRKGEKFLSLNHSREQSLHPKMEIELDLTQYYPDDSSLKKIFKRNRTFKKTYRESLQDITLCNFDKRQKIEEEERKRKIEENRKKKEKLMENRMIYYGSSNIQEEEEEEIPIKLEADDFFETIDKYDHNRTEQRKRVQFQELKAKETYLLERSRIMKAQQLVGNTLQTSESHLKQPTSKLKKSVQTQPKQQNYDYLRPYNHKEEKDPAYFKECSNKVIKLVATDVERNLKSTFEEHFKIKNKIEKNKKFYEEESNYGRRLTSQFCELRQSTFQPSELLMQVDKPKNMIDLAKKLKMDKRKKVD